MTTTQPDPDTVPSDPSVRGQYREMLHAVLNTVPRDLMLDMIDVARAAAVSTEYPKVVTIAHDDGTVTAACPWQGCDGKRVQMYEDSTRYNDPEWSNDGDGIDLFVRFDQDRRDDYEGVTPICATCYRPVSFPDCVTEV